jgi:sec-independent protein translocase protein TatC
METKMLNKDSGFWDHILELRKRIIISLIFIFIFSVFAFIFYSYFSNEISKIINENLYVTRIEEAFLIKLQSSIFIGIFFAVPVILFEITIFIFPALKKNEKTIFIIVLTAVYLLFAGGIIFGLKVILPAAVVFFKSNSFFPDNVKTLFSYEQFVMFFFQFIIIFGLSFEFPVIIIFLLKLNIIKFNFLVKNFKYFIIIAFISSAILTPTVDIFSQTAMAVPMILLYTLTLFIAKIFGLGKI